MKFVAPAAVAAIEAGTAIVTGAVQITPRGAGTIIRLWGGHGPITFGGLTYQGIGDRGLVQRTAGAMGGVAQGLALSLSAVEPHALALLDPAEVKGASVKVSRLIFANDCRTLLDAGVFERGRGDALTSEATIGAAAAINYAVESAARGLGRSGARLRSDPDQRLIDPNDGYYRNTAYAGEKKLFWAGKKPVRTAAAISPPTGDSM
jgi:hypothetical protein